MKTIDLRPNVKVNYQGIVRVVSGIRPDPKWKIGDAGVQPYEVILCPVPGGRWDYRSSAQDLEFMQLIGER